MRRARHCGLDRLRIAAFALLLGATIAAGAAFYLAGRRIDRLRPLIGLAPPPRRVAATPRAA